MNAASKQPEWRVSKTQRSRARVLRRDSTDAEQIIWRALRAHRLNGANFRRQTPVGRYIVDFACHDRRLIVEVDGDQHSEAMRDVERDRWLNSKGYRVLRVWNSDVLKNRAGVLQTILDAARAATPLPNPPPQGGRGSRRAAREATS